MRQSWVVVILRDGYCVPFDDSPLLRSHTPVAFIASRVGSPRAPALRQEVGARLAKGTLGITLGPGPGFTSDCWRPMISLSHTNEFALLTPFLKNPVFLCCFLQRERVFLALLDLGIAYFQIPIRPSSRILLWIHVRENGLYFPFLVCQPISSPSPGSLQLCLGGHALLWYAFSAIWTIVSFLSPWSEKPNRRSSSCPPIVSSVGL